MSEEELLKSIERKLDLNNKFLQLLLVEQQKTNKILTESEKRK